MGRGRGAPIPQHRPRPLPPPPRRTLADVIMEKITEKQTEVQTALSELSGRPMPQLDPRVLEVYRGVREVRALQPPGPTYTFGVTPPATEKWGRPTPGGAVQALLLLPSGMPWSSTL